MQNLKEIIQYNNTFYIHLRKLHIGNRLQSQSQNLNFAHLKQEVAMKLKADYANRMMKKMKVPPTAFKALSETATLSEEQEQIITQLDQQLKQKLQQDLAIDKLQQLFNYVNQGNNGKSLQQCIDGIFSSQWQQNLRDTFNILNQCLALLGSGGTALGALLLSTLEDNNFQDFTAAGKALKKQLESFKIARNLTLIEKQSLTSAVNQLNNLAHALAEKQFKSTGSDLTAKGLSTLILNNIISTSIAEGLTVMMKSSADNILYNTIKKAVGTSALMSIDADGIEKKTTGKTDIAIDRLKMHADINGTSQEIRLNIGLSSKFYTSKSFLGGRSVPAGSFNLGSGGSMKEALSTIFPNLEDRYLAYNYMAHNLHTKEMNDLILTRQILRLSATSGSIKDFSQYILFNGKLLSVWDLVLYAASTNLELSRSMSGSSSQGIVLSITDRKDWKVKAYTPEEDESVTQAAWRRSREQNININQARIKAEVHIANLAKALGNKF